MIPLGISIAAGVRVGNALGAGHPDAAKRAAKVAIGLIVCIDLVVFAIFFGLQDMSGRVFTDNSEVLSLYTKNIRFMSAYFLFDGVQGVCSGIIRGSGRQTIGVLINFLAYCCIGLPCGITLMFLVFHEITGLWIGLGIGVLTQASLYVILLWRTDWEKQALLAKGRTAIKAAVYNTSETWIDVEVNRRERDAMLSSWIYKTSSLPFLRRFHAGNNHFELLTSDENKRTECNGELELMQEDNASGRACDANHLIRLISSEKKSLIRKRLIPLGISLLILGAAIVVRFLVPLPPSYETATVGNKTVSGNITGNLTTQAPVLTNLDKTII